MAGTTSQVCLGFDDFNSLRSTAQVYCQIPTGIKFFSHNRFREEDDRDKMPFSSHHVKSMYIPSA